MGFFFSPANVLISDLPHRGACVGFCTLGLSQEVKNLLVRWILGGFGCCSFQRHFLGGNDFEIGDSC